MPKICPPFCRTGSEEADLAMLALTAAVVLLPLAIGFAAVYFRRLVR